VVRSASTPESITKSETQKDAAPPHEEERDIWWGSYAGRTMLPSFVLSGLLTLLICLTAWYIWQRYDTDPLTARYVAYALVGPLWLFQLGRWSHRLFLVDYRLTTRRVFLERCFSYAPFVAVELRHVAKVLVQRTGVERWLGVARISLLGGTDVTPLVVLAGVWQPERVANEIRFLAEKARSPSSGAAAPRETS
jgi:hypothetical protein